MRRQWSLREPGGPGWTFCGMVLDGGVHDHADHAWWIMRIMQRWKTSEFAAASLKHFLKCIACP